MTIKGLPFDRFDIGWCVPEGTFDRWRVNIWHQAEYRKPWKVLAHGEGRTLATALRSAADQIEELERDRDNQDRRTRDALDALVAAS
jgi:hypothetical protein